ncbi:hypothetical protein N7517_008178 [Penicillium concentricum]|uniref:Uncharacterized protein n=1 Tax=Penicillium concentricum TaxID=293559 RepID=A0A9W9V1F2_9EURO|nr:uncharacterized protein N7517_008178 [Penicillium concentricum]KAJ5365292.1 hypothetical protein N7517_008178 [Penicillium concentricum]
MSILFRSPPFRILKTFPVVKAITTRFETLTGTTGKIPDTTSQSKSFSGSSSKLVEWKEISNGQPEFQSLDIVASVDMETVSMDANKFLETMKKAWIRLRYLHSTLATEVGQNKFRYMPLKDQADVDNLLEKTFIVKE